MNIRDIQLKVCGMRDGRNIMEVAEAHPHFMGFIFYAGSPRYVGEDFKIPSNFPVTTKRVGVFVNETTERIIRSIQDFKLDFIQLHGNESAQQCGELKNYPVGIIKVFSVDDDMDFEITKQYQDVVDFFLFDTKGKFYGGNARAFNWDVLTRYDQKIPFFLSGGITPDNVSDIQKISGLNVYAIDVNSGVEIQPAMKDVKKIKAIKSMLNSKY